MTDLRPPPVGPLDDATRARVRERIVAGSQGPSVTTHAWWIPLAAAVAVLAIALGTGWVALGPGGEGQPAGPPRPTETPSVEESPLASLGPSAPPTGHGGARTPCRRTVARPLGPGAAQVAAWTLPGGEAGIWVSGDRSVFCEHSGGVATMHRIRPTEVDGAMGRDQLGFSTTSYLMTSEQEVMSFVAGGPVPDGVTAINYTFPDGQVQAADFVTDDAGRRWWVMAYVVAEGPLAPDRVNLLRLDPVRVVVSRSGTQDEVVLQWGADECAQVNHGC